MTLRAAITDADRDAWRGHLISRAADLFSNGAALSFSAGCDSAVALFAAKEAGYTPRCYFLRHRNDADAFRIAREMTVYVNATLVEVTAAEGDSYQRFEHIVKTLDWRRASGILPFVVVNAGVLFTLYPAFAEKRDLNVVTGMMADHLYQTRWNSQALLESLGDEGIAPYRIPRMDDPDLTGYHIREQAKILYDINVTDFYDDYWQAAWFQKFTHAAINGVNTCKQVARDTFADYWKHGDWWRAPTSAATRNRDINADENLKPIFESMAQNHGKAFAVDVPPRDGRGLVVSIPA